MGLGLGLGLEGLDLGLGLGDRLLINCKVNTSPASMFVRACLNGRGSRCRPPGASGPPRDSSAEEADGSNPHNNDPEKVIFVSCLGIFFLYL